MWYIRQIHRLFAKHFDIITKKLDNLFVNIRQMYYIVNIANAYDEFILFVVMLKQVFLELARQRKLLRAV